MNENITNSECKFIYIIASDFTLVPFCIQIFKIIFNLYTVYPRIDFTYCTCNGSNIWEYRLDILDR